MNVRTGKNIQANNVYRLSTIIDPNAYKFNILRRIQDNQFICTFRVNRNKNTATISRAPIPSINISIIRQNL